MCRLNDLLDESKCYEEVRRKRWPHGVRCPCCTSNKINPRGKNHRQQACRRYSCKNCGKRFDDLTGTIFMGRHQPLPVWLAYLYLMGLNLSNRQIAKELNLLAGGLRGIGQPDPDPDLRRQAETLLQTLLRAEGLPDRGVYRPGEVCRLLRISPTTLRQFCELTEHPAVKNPDPRALESFLVGCHHRISHAALVDWLMRNQKFEREG